VSSSHPLCTLLLMLPFSSPPSSHTKSLYPAFTSGGQTSPHKPRLVTSHSTCPPLSSSIVRGHDTNCIKQRYKTSARLLPLESPARGCSGSKFFCASEPAVQGRSSHAPSPAHPSLDLDHALLRALAFAPPFDGGGPNSKTSSYKVG